MRRSMQAEVLKKNKGITKNELPKPLTKEVIIEPGLAIFTVLDDVSHKLTELTVLTQKNESLLTQILRENQDNADQGEYIRREETANPNTFNIYDFLGILGFPVKGFYLKNDGANTIIYGHNITEFSIDASINTNDARFSSLYTHEEERFIFNRKRIKNIYILSVGGNSAYRLKAVW